MLYLVATPIGNMDDMTFRAIETLKSVDLIACEDTRTSRKLLDHFDIHTPVTSYHEFNKIDKAEYLLERLGAGENVAVITDAGLPGISDPGEELVAMCYERGLEVTTIPGACAAVTAITMSGQSSRRFSF
ncbi:MAG: 16S rRNA (cytidine(1402)-2'-O)-methyltransferase, partial [Lachnospiraceae bacterium]|nr:16S rRNA (cytidine(1402)-2'-O)-methyltransferase [Lachnospiraceae bacterium]